MPNRADDPEVRERPVLLLLWLLSGAMVLLAVPEPPVAVRALAFVGVAAFGILVVRLLMLGFSGYERFVGLKIIRRPEGSARGRRWLVVCAIAVGAGLAFLTAFQAFWADLPMMDDPNLALWWGRIRLLAVAVVAIATFFGLLIFISQYFSVFGTTSIFGVVLGVAALLVVQSVATGFQHEFERRVLGVYAHINVTRPFGIPEYRRFEAWLRTLDGVEGASPFVYYAMALAPSDDKGERTDDIRLARVLVKGIDPETAHEVTDVREHLEKGSGRPVPVTDLRSDLVLRPVDDRDALDLPPVLADFEDPRGQGANDAALKAYEAQPSGNMFERYAPLPGVTDDDDEWLDPPEIDVVTDVDRSTLPTMFVGKTLARELDLHEGDVVRLVDPGATFDHTEEPKFRYYHVVGIFEAGFQEYDSRLVYVHIKELEWFKYRGKDIVSGVDLRLTDANLAPAVGAVIRDELGEEYSVLEWQKLNENLFSSIATQKNAITIVLSLVIFVASFNVLSALWTMVLRRTPEVAILMSMGSTGPQIGRVFQVTGMTIGLAGSLAGIAFGLMMCWLVQLYGYTLDPEVYFIERLPVEVSIVTIGWILGLALSICFVATIPPALYAAWMRPVEGLRYE